MYKYKVTKIEVTFSRQCAGSDLDGLITVYITWQAAIRPLVSICLLRKTVRLGSNGRTLLVHQCGLTKVEPSRQCGNVGDQHDHTKFAFWFLSNISAQQMCAW